MSPVVLPPVSTAYCSLSRAPPPDSVRDQPGTDRTLVVDPAVFDRVSKFWVDAEPRVVRLMHWPKTVSAGRAAIARTQSVRSARLDKRVILRLGMVNAAIGIARILSVRGSGA